MPLFTQDKSANSTADQSMHFWGICCESGKQYAQVVGRRFRMTMAVLDPKSSSKSGDKTVSLIVIRGGVKYLLCVLKHDEIHQVNLNLIFDKGENVKFYILGYGKVYLSGYQLTDSEIDVLNDERGYLCPLVEVSKRREVKVPETPQNTKSQPVTPKSKNKLELDKNDVVSSDKRKKGDKKKNVNEEDIKIVDLEFNDESESDDEDFQIENESDSDEEESYESEDEDDDDEEEEEEEEEEEGECEEEEVEGEEELEEIVFTKKSQKKRKLENISQPQKRSRIDSCNSSFVVEKSENAECLDDKESKNSSDSDVLDSSIGNTPMPKKQNLMEKKKSKKKKRLSEISNLSEKSFKGQKLPAAESTPNKTTDNSVKKLEGGVEIQDVVIGRGPEARKGNMVHVFYVGRLQNKQIFDSRVPGKKPFSFKLGVQQVIKGWDIGIQGMRVGGKRKLKIPPNMAYGSSATEGIPPNSTLFFVVELQAVS